MKLKLKFNDATMYHFTGIKKDFKNPKDGMVFHGLRDSVGGYLGFNDAANKLMYLAPNQKMFDVADYEGDKIFQDFIFPPITYDHAKKEYDGEIRTMDFIRGAKTTYEYTSGRSSGNIDLGVFIYLYTHGDGEGELKYNHITSALPEYHWIISKTPHDEGTFLKPENLEVLTSPKKYKEYISKAREELKPLPRQKFKVIKAGFYDSTLSNEELVAARFEEDETAIYETPMESSQEIAVTLEGDVAYLTHEEITNRLITPNLKEIWNALVEVGRIPKGTRYIPDEYLLGFWFIQYTQVGYDMYKGTSTDEKIRYKYRGLHDLFTRAYYKTKNVETEPIVGTVFNKVLNDLKNNRDKLLAAVNADPESVDNLRAFIKFMDQYRAYPELFEDINIREYKDQLVKLDPAHTNNLILNAIKDSQDKPTEDNFIKLIKLIKRNPKASLEGVDLNKTLAEAEASLNKIYEDDARADIEGLLANIKGAHDKGYSDIVEEFLETFETLDKYYPVELLKEYEADFAKYKTEVK